MARTGGGKRGTRGAPAPKSAPIHTAMKPMSPEWHDAKRSAMHRQAKAARAAHDVKRAKLHPPEHHGGFQCTNCGWGGWHLHHVATAEGKRHATLGFKGCSHCGTLHPTQLHLHKTEAAEQAIWDDVIKTMDTTETAVQGAPSADVVGHRSNCPKGGNAPCGKAVEGRCSRCSAMVQDHAAVGKTVSGTVDELRKMAGLA